MNISSRQLKAFVLTARHQSFSRAAEKLFMTQSGMSVLMRELEGQLGFRLFDRTTRKVALTESGTKFLPIADRSLLELEAAASVIGRAASVANRRIAIGATPLIASKLLPSVISDYAPHNPIQQLIDRNLQRFGRREPPDMVFDYFETQIAMVEAGVGCAVIPTFAIPACRRRRVAIHPLTDPIVPIDLCQIASRGRKLPPGLEDFSRFLKSY